MPTLARFLAAFAALVLPLLALPQEDDELLRLLGPPRAPERVRSRLPLGPVWGAMPMRPRDANAVFATADGCAICHEASPYARAMRGADGRDVSPFGLWQGTMMANSFRDPYFRAALSRELAAAPARTDEIASACLTCHAPMAHHTARLGEVALAGMAELEWDPLARDGVSCAVCHQIRPEGLGEASTFDGKVDIRVGRLIYGPYENPVQQFMVNDTAYTPIHGPHVAQSAMCGTCHTLTTVEPETGAHFLEQAPYLEWRNSAFSTEETPGPEARSCQECHMRDLGTMRIARSPSGGDYGIAARPGVRGHAFLGSNAFMIDLLARNAEDLGVTASRTVMAMLAEETRTFLGTQSATLAIERAAAAEGRLRFDVAVRNETGHKLPTGYPSRRAWLAVTVRQGGRVVFESGRPDAEGRLRGVPDERAIPHRDRVSRPEEVVVYEMVPLDRSGLPTTLLTAMVQVAKDSRLLPRGYRPGGPHAEETRPVGTEADPDFAAGGDVVHFDLELARGEGTIEVAAELLFETIPAAWVAPLREVDTDEASAFVAYFDAAERVPERLAAASLVLP